MINKNHLIIILIFTSILLTINIVSATENNTNNTEIISSDTPTYTTLYTEIQNAEENEEITLTKDYTYYINLDDKTFKNDKIIPINKTLTINGNGHTINGNNLARSFNIEDDTDNVVLKNIIFKNCYNDKQGHRILETRSNTIIQNCTFINCHGSDSASGIINLFGNNNIIQDCKFQNCYNTIYYKPTSTSETLNGGIIQVCGWYNTIINCNFTNCYNNYTNYNPASHTIKGDVIYTIMDHNSIEKCTFKNIKIYKTPHVGVTKYGDVYIDSWESNITDCTFDTSTLSYNGVFIYNNAAQVNITRCTFKNSEYASVYVKGSDCILSDSEFINCKHYATKWTGANGVMTGCNFTDCEFNEKVNDWTGKNGNYIDQNNNTSSETENNSTTVDENQTQLNNTTNTTDETTQNNIIPKPSETPTLKQDTIKKIKKVTPKITAVKKKTFKVKKKIKKYTVKLTLNNKPLNKAVIKLKIKGKTYTVKTNKKGIGTFKIKNLNKKGKYKGIITFPTTKYYNSKKVKTWITVK